MRALVPLSRRRVSGATAGRGNIKRNIERGDTMTLRTSIAISTGAVVALAYIVPVNAGGDKIDFPANYAQGALYTTIDRPDNKQYRELFVSPPSARP